jgi:hypothetical protein
MRAIPSLPKANLHLHLTGAMRPATLAEFAGRYGLPLPGPLPSSAQYGWETFQERYDAARGVRPLWTMPRWRGRLARGLTVTGAGGSQRNRKYPSAAGPRRIR